MSVLRKRARVLGIAGAVSVAAAAAAIGCGGILGVEEISISADPDGGVTSDGSTPPDPCADAAACRDATADAPWADAPPSPPAPPLTNPQLWLDARLVPPGSSAALWEDASGNGADAVGGVSIDVIAGAINGRPAMRFKGQAAQTMRVTNNSPDFSLVDGFAIFVVARAERTPAPTQCALLTRVTDPNRNGIGLWWQGTTDPQVKATLFSYDATTPKDVALTLLDVPIFGPHVYGLSVLGSTFTLSRDGFVEQTGTIAAENPSFVLNGSVPLSIAGPSSGGVEGEFFSGDIGEVLVYSSGVAPTPFSGALFKLKADWGIP